MLSAGEGFGGGGELKTGGTKMVRWCHGNCLLTPGCKVVIFVCVVLMGFVIFGIAGKLK